jgi:hypothetical protein
MLSGGNSLLSEIDADRGSGWSIKVECAKDARRIGEVGKMNEEPFAGRFPAPLKLGNLIVDISVRN